jgi:hypothetical protein
MKGRSATKVRQVSGRKTVIRNEDIHYCTVERETDISNGGRH